MREIVKFTVQKNKAGQKTYLNEDDESLVVASADIEGDHGLPLDCRGVSHQLQNFFKAVKYRCGDYGIQENH